MLSAKNDDFSLLFCLSIAILLNENVDNVNSYRNFTETFDFH